MRSARLFAWVACLVLPAWPSVSRAEQLPFRHYGPAEGLEGTVIMAIHQDRHGYVWFGATDGLARFDGYRFTNYGVRDGLAGPSVHAIAEDRQGRLWFGTNGAGVARLVEHPAASAPDPDGKAAPRAKFVVYRVDESEESNRLTGIACDAEGRVWALTNRGLYRGEYRGDTDTLKFEPVLPRGPLALFMPLFLDSRQRLWAGIFRELVLIERGRVTRWEPPDPVAAEGVRAFVEDAQGRILAANEYGLFEYLPPVAGVGRGDWRRLPLTLAPQQKIRSMWIARSGVLWIGTTRGLIRYAGGGQARYTSANGLPNDVVWTLHGDREGNLWIGTEGGPARLSGEGTPSWTHADGLLDEHLDKVVAARDGRIYVHAAHGGFAQIVGGKAVLIQSSQQGRSKWLNPSALVSQVLEDRRGDWWATAWHGAYRLPGPALQFETAQRFGAAHGIPEGTEFGGNGNGLHEDAAGRIWIASRRGFLRCDAPSSRSPSFAFLPVVGLEWDEFVDVLSDRSGNVWFGTLRDVARIVDGRIERVLPDEWRPAPSPRCLFVDSRGRLWVGLRNRGLYLTADPGARQPRWTHYSTDDGLSSDTVNAVAEDRLGRIYVGTPRGLDRLDLDTGRVRTFTSLDGLAGGYVKDLLTDRNGQLWVATRTGLTRLDPQPEPKPEPPPPVFFTRVQVAGEELRLPERGTREIPPLRLASSDNNLLIEYVGVSFRAGGSLRYQYRLEGVDADWSAPGEQRSINYARLAPGSYRLRVRTVSPEGKASLEPATLAFEIATPFWQSRWFFALAALAVAVVVEARQRLRLRRRLELEAVRTRIATDLHDDIGSNLSRIAILTEVARRDLDGGSRAVKDRLSHIAAVSRDLVDSMSDIVWAVNPARDHLRDLTQRMRHFADDILSARDIGLRFRAPPEADDIPLGTHTRRELFLVFKEAVNNVARHSGARSVQIELAVGDGWLSLKLTDDGHGFDTGRVGADSGEGNGLRSMQRRARDLGGSFDVVSAPGQGAFLTVRIPLGRRPWVGRTRAPASPSSRL